MSLRLCWLTLSAGCSVLMHGASGAYLPELGPSPVRFRASPIFVATVAMLPPLRRDDSPREEESPKPPPPTEFASVAPIELFGPPAPVVSTNPTLVEPAESQLSATTPAESEARLTPQMFVEFFKGIAPMTNAAPALPIGSFTPPQPPPSAPSSSATYRSN
ncbi:MAG TPA: hypothetical protein VK530_01100 [Candidatus Acidoferrum sp.]|nr:hypothetical protein [Candidatus Acidoferrum sp.]